MLILDGHSTACNPGYGRIRFAVVSNPEFLQEGRAIANSLYPDRIVVGAENAEMFGVMAKSQSQNR